MVSSLVFELIRVGSDLAHHIVCGHLGFGENSMRYSAGATGSSNTVYYTCKEGFEMAGGDINLTITCQSDGQWTAAPAQCRRKHHCWFYIFN